MNVAFLPVYPNPYQRLLRDGLALSGVSVEFLDELPPAGWLRRNKGHIDLLHLHWLSGLYMNRFRTPIRAAQFLAWFRQARALGYGLVWTAHNVMPHNAPFRPLHTAIRRLVMAEADAVIVHCNHGRRELLDRFPRTGPTEVVPLGTYEDVYHITITREAARAALGIAPRQFVYLALGNIAAYKGLESFAEAFGKSATPDDVAIIAGRNRDKALVARLQRSAARDPRLRVHAQFIPDDAMQQYLLAADVLVAPFERVLTSSSVMVGLSYGLPVIVPNLGCLPELVAEEAGLIYQSTSPGALGQALADIRVADRKAMSAAARRLSGGLRWEAIGRRTAAVYEACLKP